MTSQKSPAAEAEDFLARHPDIQYFDMLIPDMNGILRGKQLARDYLAKLYTDGVRMPGSNYLLDWTGQNIATLPYGTADGDPDYFCFAAPGTLVPVPWSRRPSGQVIASMSDDTGEPHFADPRHLLGQVLDRFKDLKLTPVIALELEFYLVDEEAASRGDIRPARSPQSKLGSTITNVYGLDDLYDFEALLDDVHLACEIQDIPAETFVSEYAAGQFEINIHHSDDALKACDQSIMLERCIKQVARRHGVIATFMAKPFAGSAGSGMHVHVSLLDQDGNNVMAGDVDPVVGQPISDTLRHAVGGLIQSMPEGMAIFSPNANSYRRLRPGAYAPVTGHWGGDNRTLPIRVPGGSRKAVRIEHRVAGADANPYLVVATVLAGIHHGIANGIAAPRPTAGDGYAQDGVELPIRWPLALEAFDKGKILRRYFGDKWTECFIEARYFESENHHYTINALDYEWYLRTA